MKVLHCIENLKERTFLQIFTIYLRYLIGGVFIIAAIGMGKLSENSSLLDSARTPIQDLLPMQQFFRVMEDSGMYWKFIGWTQIVTGFLLMTQRFARLGAAIFFGMMLNIFIITVSYHFQGTTVVAGLLLLASIYLIIWDARYFSFLISDDSQPIFSLPHVIKQAYWIKLGFIMIGTILILILFQKNTLYQLAVPFLEGLIGYIGFVVKSRFGSQSK